MSNLQGFSRKYIAQSYGILSVSQFKVNVHYKVFKERALYS